MFEINDDFLTKVGHKNLSEERKEELIDKYTTELERRVNRAIIDSLDESQLVEFNEISDLKDIQSMESWLDKKFPNYKEGQDYKVTFKESQPFFEELSLFATLKWLGQNVPEIANIVRGEMDEFMIELIKITSLAQVTAAQ